MKKLITVVLVSGLVLAGCTKRSSPSSPSSSTSVSPSQSPSSTKSSSKPSSSANPSKTSTVKPSSSPVVVTHSPSVPPVPVLTNIRVGVHTGFDRVVFDFTGELPGYTVKFVDVAIADGSGKSVDVPGRKLLQVTFKPANAHREDGISTITQRTVYNYPSVRSVVLTGDFEGVVSVVIGVVDDNPVTVKELSGRVYIDVPHTDEVGA